jgi:LuxR family transcriptional regulator, maltose regulon positive regulatory protein
MSTPMLATKLFIPPTRPDVIIRARLIERLNRGLHGKLTLISAPAGFGKTTLVSAWIARMERPSAWLSLEVEDNDPARFLTYLVAAFQTVIPELGSEVLGMLRSAQPPPMDSMLTALVNEITTRSDPFVLVLDDYHLIDAQPVDDALTFLIEHLPPPLHLVMTTREDPPFPLARLRARGQLTELRAADLRFSSAEAVEFLNTAMGLRLSAADIGVLEDRTEGWIAGLQLAALSLQGHEDAAQFVRTFAGNHRYIVDYLVEEVLRRQPETNRRFLLQTAILDRLHGPLCDAVTGQVQGAARLEALERGNFFVIPLDDQRQWYRYHHLFAEVLATQLRAEQPELVPTLHRRASDWYAHQAMAANAIRHALAAENFERAAELVELAFPEMLRNRQEATLVSWLQALPPELFQVRPVLSAGYASALMSTGEFEGVDAYLQNAERWLDSTTGPNVRREARPSEMVVVDEAGFRRLPGWIAVSRAGLALTRGDVAATVTYARRALALVPEDDHLGRGAAAALLGLASWASGDLEAAHQSYSDSLASMQRAGHLSDIFGCALALADMEMAQGRLHEARRTFERALQLTAVPGAPALRGMADMHVGLSELALERNDFALALEYLRQSQDLGEHAGLPQNPYRRRVAMARIHAAQGDLDAAVDLLEEAERRYTTDFSPPVRPVPALKTRVWIAQGKLAEALGWAREAGLSARDDLSYVREFDHLTLARVLIARSQNDRADGCLEEAIGLLERLLEAAEAGGRTGSIIEILVLQAIAHQLQSDLPAALGSLERSLTLAEPEGYVRIYVDEGPPMAVLLEVAARHGIAPDYVRRLRSALGEAKDHAPANQTLIEPLSERELDVLRLLGTDLSGPEMARELVVSPNTVHTHIGNIYSKLGVNNRRAAVRRAQEIGLF